MAAPLRIATCDTHGDALTANDVQAHFVSSNVCVKALYTSAHFDAGPGVCIACVVGEGNGFQIVHPKA